MSDVSGNEYPQRVNDQKHTMAFIDDSKKGPAFFKICKGRQRTSLWRGKKQHE